MQLSVRLVPVGETTLVVALTGELDSTTRPVLAAFLDPLPQSRVKYVVVAAADLWFCDLNGLEQLAITHRAMQAKGGYLAVAEAKQPLRRLIALMAEHAQPAIPVYASMPEALAETDVDVYEVPQPPTPVPRHMPALRTVPKSVNGGGDRPLPRRKPEPREAGAPPLSLVMDRSRHLREQTLRQRYTLTRQLLEAGESRLLLQSARERCSASLAALRTNRAVILTAISGAPAAPLTKNAAGTHDDGITGQGRRYADGRA
ncbi:STAS domain-containing protein [Actinomadura sp. ATCC 31491]|uniref:STAS domain-containing protein n=1 Tax=Actinomadura luzonensis TaxID=2805427 RepID=A0ABT0FNZ0_9ACTN|nr:STAS domain-containing protein [Actinomadura luzonensis]MCK2213873.1 STAS domain-containing protein [Actinomadura luzonensis]